MFKDDVQRALICKTVLGSLGMDKFWTEHGPTELAKDIWAQKTHGVWSHGEQIIWKITWQLWNGDEDLDVPFGEMLYTLDPERLELVGTLLMAMSIGSAAMDAWLALWGPRIAVSS